MLNMKEVIQHLSEEGITANEQLVTRWIREGKIKTSRTTRIKIDYSIDPDDLAAFILEKKLDKMKQQFEIDDQEWVRKFFENQTLKEEIEELKIMIRIEQAKIRSLKKMLQAEYELSDSKPLTLNNLLGLDSAAEKELVKRELKKILKSLHPDRGGDERLFKVFYDHYDKVK